MYRFKTLGGVVLEGESGPVSGRSSLRRRLALLALLASARDRGVPRDKLVAYLWPERDAEHGRHSLSQLLHALRRELGADAITIGVDDLRLNSSAIWTDIGAFTEAIDQGRLEDAVALYAGPFLDGFFLSDALDFEHWVEDERARVAARYAASLETLAERATKEGHHREAVRLWRLRVAADALNARLVCELMRALAQSGDRAGALQQARLHEQSLQRELGLEPDATVSALARRLTNLPAADVGPIVVETPRADSPARELPPAPERGWLKRVALVGVLTALALGALVRPITHAFESVQRTPRMVVLGAVDGTDRGLALAVAEALRAELESASGLRVASDARVREALLLMKLRPETPMMDSVVAQVAARLGAPFAITATAQPVGSGAEIVARLIDSRDGATIGTVAAHPATSEEVVPALTKLSETLRERALNIQVAQVAPPLPAVTTSSIAALRDYAFARQAVAQGDNERAISYAEAAVTEDSAFALAHYLLGDLLWYVDRQHHSDEHLERAFELSERLPPRERLIVRARYEQLVRDRPDTALQYWKLLRTAYPGEPRAYEGMAWAYTALGYTRLADAAADTAFQLDSTVGARGVRGHLGRLIASGDSAGAIAYARSNGPGMLFTAMYAFAYGQRNWNGVLTLLDSARPYGVAPGRAGALRQVALVALGRLAEAGRALEEVRADPQVQYLPRALLLQGRAEVTEGSRARGAALAREALAWVRAADLSPPAFARLAERIADVAARANDTATVGATRRFIVARDAGRNLRSYTIAMSTIDACDAFTRGDMRSVVSDIERRRGQMFYGRPVSITLQLEADALAALGDRRRADSIYEMLASPTATFVDGDNETFEAVRRAAALALGSARTARARE